MASTDRQKDIVDAAFNLISGQGIQELTIKKIASAIGVSEPAIYRHFASKSDILDAIVDEIIASRDLTLSLIKSDKMDSSSLLTNFFTVQARMFTDNPSMTIMLLPEEIFRNDKDLQDRISGMMAETRLFIHTLLITGISEGIFHARTDPETLSLMLIGGFRLLVSSWRLQNHGFNLENRTKVYVESALPLFRV